MGATGMKPGGSGGAPGGSGGPTPAAGAPPQAVAATDRLVMLPAAGGALMRRSDVGAVVGRPKVGGGIGVDVSPAAPPVRGAKEPVVVPRGRCRERPAWAGRASWRGVAAETAAPGRVGASNAVRALDAATAAAASVAASLLLRLDPRLQAPAAAVGDRSTGVLFIPVRAPGVGGCDATRGTSAVVTTRCCFWSVPVPERKMYSPSSGSPSRTTTEPPDTRRWMACCRQVHGVGGPRSIAFLCLSLPPNHRTHMSQHAELCSRAAREERDADEEGGDISVDGCLERAHDVDVVVPAAKTTKFEEGRDINTVSPSC